jgi:membrane fusion protein (multidrug efflux system)
MAFIKWTVTIGACALVFGGLAAYKVMDIRAAIAAGEAYPEQSESVETALVSEADFTPALTVIGELVAPQRLDLRNELGGEITAVNFESGARVREGQVLLQLDIAVEQANLAAARARTDVAQLNFNRNEELFTKRVSTQDMLDRARAELTSAQSEIAVLERMIEQKTLRSPFNGKAGLHTFEVGQVLAPSTLITTLIGDSDHMWVDFQVPQFYPRLEPGVELDLASISGESDAPDIAATVIAENTVINAGNRSRGYRASLPDAEGVLTPHTMVELEVPVAAAERLLQVPAVAIQNDPLGQYVFVLRPDGNAFRAVRQQVSVRSIETGHALVEPGAGLSIGTTIAAAGAFKLYEGILVHARERDSGIEPAERPAQ